MVALSAEAGSVCGIHFGEEPTHGLAYVSWGIQRLHEQLCLAEGAAK
jgi:hypothetical protein